MHTVVLGGTGHIGTYLVPRLARLGHDVTCVSRGQRDPYRYHGAWQSVERTTLDREELPHDEFAARVADFDPDVLINFEPAGARAMVDALDGVRHVLHCGTIWVHGHGVEQPTTEDAPRDPFGEYGVKKAEIEEILLTAAHEDDFPVTLLHPGHIVGPGWVPLTPRGDFTPDVFERLAAGDEVAIPNIGMETVHHVHADDVAQAFERALANRSVAVGEHYHATSPAALTLRGYAERTAQFLGAEANLAFVPWSEYRDRVSEAEADTTWDHIAHSPTCSIEKARRHLGYEPRYTSMDAIEESVRWLAEHDEIAVGEWPTRESADSVR
jgi:nucleoside-diphosphate-sugar epimerase